MSEVVTLHATAAHEWAVISPTVGGLTRITLAIARVWPRLPEAVQADLRGRLAILAIPATLGGWCEGYSAEDLDGPRTPRRRPGPRFVVNVNLGTVHDTMVEAVLCHELSHAFRRHFEDPRTEAEHEAEAEADAALWWRGGAVHTQADAEGVTQEQ